MELVLYLVQDCSTENYITAQVLHKLLCQVAYNACYLTTNYLSHINVRLDHMYVIMLYPQYTYNTKTITCINVHFVPDVPSFKVTLMMIMFQEDAERFAESLGVKYMETSAKNNENVTEAFQVIKKEEKGA